MIARLISTLRPHKLPDSGEAVRDETVLAAPPDEVARFAPMVPLTPPPPVNDDPEGALCDEVEAALRGAGYLPDVQEAEDSIGLPLEPRISGTPTSG